MAHGQDTYGTPTRTPATQGLDGEVYDSIVASDGATYVGGFFDRYGPLTGGFADVSRATGLPNLQMPTVDGDVWVVLPDGSGGVYIGGSITGVGGYPRRNLAHIQANGTVSPWAPETDGRVRSIVRDGTRLFIGGEFSHVGGHHHVFQTKMTFSHLPNLT